MTKQGSLKEGSSESGSDTTADGDSLILGEEEGKESGIDWSAEIAALKGMHYGSIDDAIGDIADVVMTRLKISGSADLKNHIMESLLDDEGLCETITRELVMG